MQNEKYTIPSPTDMCIITTYRCPMRCKMCDIWQNPTEKDLDEIVEVLFSKSPRVVISTSGWFDDRVIRLAEKFPNIGIRISIEGLSRKNDELRGRDGGFDKGLRTLLTLRDMGVKDIGFGITVSNNNSNDMLSLYHLAKQLGLEFATAAFHNSYYFHKYDNQITNKDEVISNFEKLIALQLKENSPKSWFRAFFNNGLINYIEGNRRMLPCEAGLVNFFVDPYGEVYPCNGLEERYWKESMGNILTVKNFKEIWESEQARRVREQVRTCPKNCWMVGTASPVMKKYIRHPLGWVLKNKANTMLGRPLCLDRKWYDVGQSPLQGDLREDRK